MATQQYPINASGVNSVPAPANTSQRFLLIRNYLKVPSSGVAQTVSMWITFGKAATLGLGGEYELVPGGEIVFGGNLAPGDNFEVTTANLPNCPTEAVNIITSGGTALGCVIAF